MNNRKFRNLAPLAFVPLALTVGCAESVESEDVMTSGVYAMIDVTSDGDGSGADVEVRLKVGGPESNTFLDLVGDDTLTASAGEETLTLQRQNAPIETDLIWYTAHFAADGEDTEFTISFNRSIDDGAPSSKVTLPADLAITAPAENASLSMSEDITVTWEPSDKPDAIELSVNGDCIRAINATPPDSGSYTIAADDIEPIDDEDPQTCDITITVRRQRSGTLDTGYGEGGVIHGAESRSVKALLNL